MMFFLWRGLQEFIVSTHRMPTSPASSAVCLSHDEDVGRLPNEFKDVPLT